MTASPPGRLRSRTWRGMCARVTYYFNEGAVALVQVKQVVYACAAMKVLGLPLGWVVALAPVVYAAHVAAGYGWVQWGWYKQMAEVPTTDAVNPVSMWAMHMQVRLYEKLGIPMNGMALGEMPECLRGVLTSYQRSH